MTFCLFIFLKSLWFVWGFIFCVPWSKSQSFPVLYFGGCESNLNLEYSTTSNYLRNTAPLAKCIHLFNPNSNTETIVPERWWNLFHLQFVCVLLCSIFHITTTNKWHKNVCICAIRCCHNNTVENLYNENTYQIQCVNKEGSKIILIFYSFFCVCYNFILVDFNVISGNRNLLPKPKEPDELQDGTKKGGFDFAFVSFNMEHTNWVYY